MRSLTFAGLPLPVVTFLVATAGAALPGCLVERVASETRLELDVTVIERIAESRGRGESSILGGSGSTERGTYRVNALTDLLAEPSSPWSGFVRDSRARLDTHPLEILFRVGELSLGTISGRPIVAEVRMGLPSGVSRIVAQSIWDEDARTLSLSPRFSSDGLSMEDKAAFVRGEFTISIEIVGEFTPGGLPESVPLDIVWVAG